MGAMHQMLMGGKVITAPVYVGGTTAQIVSSDATTNTVSLTGLTGGIAAAAADGDIVVVAYAVNGTSDLTLAITDGSTNYTLVGSELYADDTYDINFRVAYKFMGGTPDTTVSIGPTQHATANPGAVVVSVWRGVSSTTPHDVAATTASSINDGLANPPAITPVTFGAVILAFGGGASRHTLAAFTNSGDLINFRSVVTDNTGVGTEGARAAVGSKLWAGGAFNPAAFTGFTSELTMSWGAVTMALRPANA